MSQASTQQRRALVCYTGDGDPLASVAPYV